jgi:hypothetical protein
VKADAGMAERSPLLAALVAVFVTCLITADTDFSQFQLSSGPSRCIAR